MTMHAMFISRSIRAALLVAAAAAAGCTTKDTEPPALSGPSEFGQSISVTATPDRVSQDGVSQVRAEATIRGAQGQPSQGVAVQWTVDASTGVLVEPSLQQSVTDSQGRTAIVVTAPLPPAVVPETPGRLTITAKAVGTDVASTLNTKSVVVQLVPPPGTLLPNRMPVASFTIAPAVGNINQEITFDASGTADEGEPCGSLCTYQWDFGNFETESGQRVTKRFGKAGTFTITLTVTDARGGVDSDSRSLKINGPPPPTSGFSATASGLTVAFNAAASLAGAGGTLVEYVWDFGDGTTQTTEMPGVSHAYPAVGASGTMTPYVVVLTVKDNFGQTSVSTSTVNVTTP
jgi:PKD repeat protein